MMRIRRRWSTSEDEYLSTMNRLRGQTAWRDGNPGYRFAPRLPTAAMARCQPTEIGSLLAELSKAASISF
ncbi:hypothetical protein FJ546_15690 [Mesorhizobium sp. B2-4-19]|nr:hypothetical protein FJ546_15690 [Mesorhizobium sp. B2-4-19]